MFKLNSFYTLTSNVLKTTELITILSETECDLFIFNHTNDEKTTIDKFYINELDLKFKLV